MINRHPYRARLIEALPRLALGGLLGLLALWLASRGVDWEALWSALLQVHVGLAGLSLLSIFATLILNTARWRLLFYPEHRERGWLNLFSGIVVGQMLNIIVPARLGDVARAYAVGTSEQLSKTRVLATVVVEKVADLGMFALSVVILLLSMSLPAWVRSSGGVLLTTGFLAVGAALALSFWGQSGLRWLEHPGRWLPAKWRDRVVRFGRLALEGFTALRHWRANVSLWALSLCILALSAGTNYLLFRAFDLSLPPIAAVFLLVVLQVGDAPPSLPGKLGLFHYLTVLALSVFSVERSVALSYALVLYAVALLSKIFLGAAILAWSRWLPGLRFTVSQA